METIDEKYCSSHGLDFCDVIAKGGYGIVYHVFSRHYKRDFALKRVNLSNFKQGEVKAMMSMSSPHICSLYQYNQFDNYVYMLLEYCPHSLDKELQSCKILPNELLVKYIYEILIAIEVCHDHNIAHSDIKPSNILIDKYGRIKVCDFGLAKEFDIKGSDLKHGSLCFMAPEIFTEKTYDPAKADIWALGVTFYYMATHRYPFNPKMDLESLKLLITEGIYDESLIQNNLLRNLISQCLKLNPKERPTVTELMSFPYFQDLFTTTSLKLEKMTNVSTPYFTSVQSSPKLSLRNHKITRSALFSKDIIIPRLKKKSSLFGTYY